MNKNNEKFDKLSAEQKRVEIAKDVLKQLASGKYKSSPSIWVKLNAPKSYEEDEVADVLANTKSCNVCAVGAMFCSAVMKHDQLKVVELYPEGPDERKMFQYIEKFFKLEDLQLIEAIYENGRGNTEWNEVNDSYYDSDAIFEARKFASLVQDPKQRMIFLMKNLIKHHGDLDVYDFPKPSKNWWKK